MGDFHFLRPEWFLALIPTIFILVMLWRNQSGASAWYSVFDEKLLSQLWLEPPGKVSRKPLLLIGLGWVLAMLALAGPTWERQSEQVWRSPLSRIIILDLSASMNVKDVVPSRLERARFKLMDILERSREGRTGLIVFAGEPHIVTPLTEDSETISNLLMALSPEIVPQSGDMAAPALQMAEELLLQTGVQHGELLLISDGVEDPAATLDQIRHLRAKGHRVSVLGVGTEQGGAILNTQGSFVAFSQFDAAPLQEFANAGGGAFSSMTADDSDLDRVLLETFRADLADEVAGSGVERWVERGVLLLPILLLLGAFAFRRGWLLGISLLMIIPPPAQAFGWRDLWLRSDQQAEEIWQQGDAQGAAQTFQDPNWRGVALHETGDYQAAAEAFAESATLDGKYNKGNALARAGDLKQAMTAYQDVLAEAPEHEDARTNLELVEKLLEDQQSSQDDESSGDDSSQQDDESQQDDGDANEDSTDDSAQDDPSEQQSPDGQQAEADETDALNAENDDEVDASESANSMAPEQEAMTPPEDEGDDTPVRQTESEEELPNEEEIALEQWLRQIPEDPTGLLRRKFMLEHLQRKNAQ